MTQLIQHWGGVVTDVVNVDTDFFVVGRRPFVPPRPAEEYAGGQVMQDYTRAMERDQQYQQNRQTAQSLGTPTFNLSRFLYFVGFYRQAELAAD